MLFYFPTEDHVVVETDKNKLQFNAGEADVYGALKRFRLIVVSKSYLDESVKFMERANGCLVLVVILDLDMPVSNVSVKCEENGCFTERFYIFIHM